MQARVQDLDIDIERHQVTFDERPLLLGKGALHLDEQLAEVLLERLTARLAMRPRVLGRDALGAVEIEVEEAARARGIGRIALDVAEDGTADVR